VFWMQGDLGVANVGEGSVVERASVDQDTRVIATARHLSGRGTNDPEVTEIVERAGSARMSRDLTATSPVRVGKGVSVPQSCTKTTSDS
jgi:hypothetical protein